jgi:hypothetical protein
MRVVRWSVVQCEEEWYGKLLGKFYSIWHVLNGWWWVAGLAIGRLNYVTN